MPIGPAHVAEPHPGLAFNWAILGIGALAMVVVFALRLAQPVWRLAGESAKPEGAVSAYGVERPSRVLEMLTRTGAPASAVVGGRLALEPGRGRTAVPVRSTLAGTAVAVAAVAAAFTFGTNLVRLVSTPRLYGQGWQVSVDVEFGQIPRGDVETFLRQQRGVSGWTFGNHAEVTIAGRQVATIEMTGAEGPAVFPTLLEGRAPQAPDEIVLGSKTLASARRRVGQTVMVALPGENTPRTMQVVGRAVFPFFGQGEVTPTGLGEGAALLDPGPNPDGFNFFLVGMAQGAAEHDNIARLARNLNATGVCHQECSAVTAQRPADVNNYARIKATPLALAGVLALLAVATVAHLLVTSIRRRRRDSRGAEDPRVLAASGVSRGGLAGQHRGGPRAPHRPSGGRRRWAMGLVVLRDSAGGGSRSSGATAPGAPFHPSRSGNRQRRRRGTRLAGRAPATGPRPPYRVSGRWHPRAGRHRGPFDGLTSCREAAIHVPFEANV